MNLDYFIVRTPVDEDELYCPECCIVSAKCDDELSHVGLWITQSERAEQEMEEMQSEAWGER